MILWIISSLKKNNNILFVIDILLFSNNKNVIDIFIYFLEELL